MNSWNISATLHKHPQKLKQHDNCCFGNGVLHDQYVKEAFVEVNVANLHPWSLAEKSIKSGNGYLSGLVDMSRRQKLPHHCQELSCLWTTCKGEANRLLEQQETLIASILENLALTTLSLSEARAACMCVWQWTCFDDVVLYLVFGGSHTIKLDCEKVCKINQLRWDRSTVGISGGLTHNAGSKQWLLTSTRRM